MIYLDPPYGIKFSSNWQNEVGKRDVKDKDEDLTREPEMIRAYRDTWTLGVHSYLAYLKQRLLLARELLTDSGSVFVQISDENLHRVRIVLDEVFGAENFCALIIQKKTGGQKSELIPRVSDFILWYARDVTKVRYHQLFLGKEVGIGDGSGARYDQLEEVSGQRRPLTDEEREDAKVMPSKSRPYQLTSLISAGYRPHTTVEYSFRGQIFHPGKTSNWKTTIDGIDRLAKVGRVQARSSTVAYVRFLEDFPAHPLTSVWGDVAGATDKVYVVQTSVRVIERCILMTTDPGDLVLDPTCGSGTTAFVAE